MPFLEEADDSGDKKEIHEEVCCQRKKLPSIKAKPGRVCDKNLFRMRGGGKKCDCGKIENNFCVICKKIIIPCLFFQLKENW